MHDEGHLRGADVQMFQSTLAASKPSGNLREQLGTAQLVEEHGHKLTQQVNPRAWRSA
jgi:hypothetical protein